MIFVPTNTARVGTVVDENRPQNVKEGLANPRTLVELIRFALT